METGRYSKWCASTPVFFALKELSIKQNRLFDAQLVYSCFISSTIVSPSVLVMDKLRGVVSVSFIATSIMVLGALAVLQQIRRLCSSRSGLSTSSSAQIFKWCGSGEMCG